MRNVLAQSAPSTNSKRASHYVRGVYPQFTDGYGSNCRLYDTDNRSYIDFVCALGALSLGYTNSNIEDSVIRQVKKGASHSLPTTLEVELAEIISSLIPSMERIRFFKNGRDAVDTAIVIARAYTNKSLVLTDGYHGCSDLFTSITEPALGIKDMFHVKQLEGSELTDEVACVIVEAIKLDDSLKYQEYIRNLREECRKRKICFIIDEIITGFRVPRLTVSNWWSLDPDIVLIGKGMANGYPLSAIGGKKDLINCGEWFKSMTFGGEAVSLAASKATIQEICKRNLEDLMFYGKRLQTQLNELDHDIRFEGYGTRCMFNITHPTSALFAQEMVKAGIFLGKAHFFNFAHLEANIDTFVIETARTIIDRIHHGQVRMEGEIPTESFKRN